MEKARRKSRWCLHLFNVGDTKKFNAIDMPKFRSALSIYNKNNPDCKIDYRYDRVGNNIVVTRIATNEADLNIN